MVFLTSPNYVFFTHIWNTYEYIMCFTHIIKYIMFNVFHSDILLGLLLSSEKL